jgi:hypothetical protein
VLTLAPQDRFYENSELKETIILVACGSRKFAHKSEAQYIYTSPLFRKSRNYARNSGRPWYILSGKHGLLCPTSIIEPYDLPLKRLDNEQQKKWAENVLKSLKKIEIKGNRIIFLAGKIYRKNLVPALQEQGCLIEIPLEGMAIGKQIKWLTSRLDKTYTDLDRFYELVSRLEVGLSGKRRLGDCTGKLKWPKKGLYFFFEPKEHRRGWPIVQRIVRIGTHAVSSGSKSTLWQRLRVHKGTSDGGGNHRSSIFRLYIGKAIMKREHTEALYPFWGTGMSASREIRLAEKPLEKQVTKYLSNTHLLWIEVDDAASPLSDRAYIERNAIALLSNFGDPFDPPSSNWLGNFSNNEYIRNSGLWNVQHVMEKYDPKFLDVFSEYIDVTLGRKTKPQKSIAPKSARKYKTISNKHQFRLDRWGNIE